MEGKYFAERQKVCLIHSFVECRRLEEEEDCRAEQKSEVAEKDQQIQSSECREKEVHFVPTVARISSLFIL